jgi:hypothetical protein
VSRFTNPTGGWPAADKGVRSWNFAGGAGVWIIEEE